jgi:trigger factor
MSTFDPKLFDNKFLKKSGPDLTCEIEIPGNYMKTKVMSVIKDAAKNMKVSGYRKDKIPEKVIRSRLNSSPESIVVNDVVRDQFDAIKNNTDYKIAGTPKFTTKKK